MSVQVKASTPRVSLGALLVLVTLVGRPAAAATRTWDGGDTASQRWSDADNWVGNVVPGPGDDVVFGTSSREDALIDVDLTIASLTIDGYLGRVSATPGRSVTVTGNFTQTSGTFTAPSYLVVGGRFSNSGGRFEGAGGTVFLTSAATQNHVVTTATFANLNVSDGLVAYWRLDDAANPTRDLSGGRTDLAFESTPAATTAAPTSFANPGALAFSGVEQGLTTPAGAPYPSLLKPGGWTVSLWFRPNATFFEPGAGSCGDSGAPGPGAELLSAGEDYTLRTCRATATGMNVVRLFFRTTGGIRDCVTDNGFTANGSSWHHLAATAGGGNTRTVYLDGTATSCSFSDAQTYTAGPLKIARHFSGAKYDFGGALDDVRIYNRGLAASEVQVLRQGRHPNPPAGRHIISGPLVVTGDLVVASRTLEIGTPTPMVGATYNFGGGLIIGTQAPDAGAGGGQDAQLPADAAAANDTSPDASDPPLPDAAVAADLPPDEPPPVTPDGAAPDDAPIDDPTDAAGPVQIDLRVGCACRAGGAAGSPGAALLLAVAWTVRRRLSDRRRTRR